MAELRQGMRNEAVRQLQAALNRQFPQWKQLPLMGYFGPETFEFVFSAQHALDFVPTGIADDAFQQWIGVTGIGPTTIPAFMSTSGGSSATTTDLAALLAAQQKKKQEQQTMMLAGVGIVALVLLVTLAGD